MQKIFFIWIVFIIPQEDLLILLHEITNFIIKNFLLRENIHGFDCA